MNPEQNEGNMPFVSKVQLSEVFAGIDLLDQLKDSITECAKKLVNADEAYLYLKDNKCEPTQAQQLDEIDSRMSTSSDYNSLSDNRSENSDNSCNGRTLPMPIMYEDKRLGTVKMVRRRNEDFDVKDVAVFSKVSPVFGVAIRSAYEYCINIKRSESRFKVALEKLTYHNTSTNEDVEKLKRHMDTNADLCSFYLNPYNLDELQKCKTAVKMFEDLCDTSKFDSIAVHKFVLTVKMNYRSVYYHNFCHGWSVAQAMYVILKNDDKNRFDDIMKLSMFVACLCHDLDHQGFTNAYLKNTNAPLAAMYFSSPLEHHHFNVTEIILHQDGHNILDRFSKEESKRILRYIQQCILATDLAAFTGNLETLNTNLRQGADNLIWDNSNKELAMAIAMTASDLSSSAKPWEIQFQTVEIIFKEFYLQGDEEKKNGTTPYPMLDRDNSHRKPHFQVEFLKNVCVPCFSTLMEILPNTKPMYEMARDNLTTWECLKLSNHENTTNTES